MTASPALAARGLKPIAVLGARRPHGDRLRYMSGCRCAACRRANSLYECVRAKARRNGDWNGIVPATKARRHLLRLSSEGVGRDSVASVTGISRSIIAGIRSGKRRRLRARSERKILAVTSAQRADKTHVSAAATWKLIDSLIEEGFTKAFLALCLGYARPAIQLNKKLVTVRNAHQVACLYRELTA